MAEYETRNAIIDDVSIRIDRGFCLCVWVTLNYGGSIQGFGGYVLGGVGDAACANHADQPNLAAEFIVKCMEAAGVEDWASMKGKTIRVRSNHGGVHSIGHIVKDDKWFAPRDVFEGWKARKKEAE